MWTYWLGLTLEWGSVALLVWIFILMGQKHLYRRFPLFTLYTAALVLVTILRSAFLSHRHAYFYVYWLTEPAEVLLAVLAVHESFLAVFRGFYRLTWFRLLFPGAIVTALAYSAWKAYAHSPIHASRWGAAIISTSIASQYVILGICVLFFLLERAFSVHWRLYEFRIVFGFGIAALGDVAAGVIRSELGSKLSFLSEYLPGLLFLMAVIVWLSAMLEEEPSGAATIAGTTQERKAILEGLRYHMQVLRKFVGKK